MLIAWCFASTGRAGAPSYAAAAIGALLMEDETVVDEKIYCRAGRRAESVLRMISAS